MDYSVKDVYLKSLSGGKYRTKNSNTYDKARKAFIKSLMKKGYTEKGAKMLFGKEEKIKKRIKTTRKWKGPNHKIQKQIKHTPPSRHPPRPPYKQIKHTPPSRQPPRPPYKQIEYTSPTQMIASHDASQKFPLIVNSFGKQIQINNYDELINVIKLLDEKIKKESRLVNDIIMNYNPMQETITKRKGRLSKQPTLTKEERKKVSTERRERTNLIIEMEELKNEKKNIVSLMNERIKNDKQLLGSLSKNLVYFQ
jgi:hypothetical protein